jgi:AcrR family transcriptional regulator
MVRDEIVLAATRTFARDGALGSRLEDIRRDAGVSVGAVYHHFADKEALYAAAWMRALGSYQADFLEALRGSTDAEDGVRSVVERQIRWVVTHRDAAIMLYGGRPSGEDAEEHLAAQNRVFFAEVMRWWRLHAGYGSLRDLEPLLLHALWLGAADSYCRHWVGTEQNEVPPELVRALADAAWDTLKGDRST